MASVISALKTSDDVGLFCQDVYNLTFPFISPLGAYDDNIRHDQLLFTIDGQGGPPNP
jgi:hypothetical protein